VIGINRFWRGARCEPGEGSGLGDHFDGRHVPTVDMKSIYTCMIYATGGGPAGEEAGGEVKFVTDARGKVGLAEELVVQPRPGRLVLFDQMLLHKALPCLEVPISKCLQISPLPSFRLRHNFNHPAEWWRRGLPFSGRA
jgi:hypothetical protein